MTREEVVKILAETETDFSQKQRVYRGLHILAKYDDDLETSFEHDQIFVSDFDSSIAKMTREDMVNLAAWGWFESHGSWSHY